MTTCVINSPSDWPDYVPELSTIDNLLRCAICFEYMKVSMILPQCSHNYCSLCIRKYLSYKSQCPTCLMAVSEPEMKNNRLVDDLIKNFILVRSKLLQAVKSLNFKKSIKDNRNNKNCSSPKSLKTSPIKDQLQHQLVSSASSQESEVLKQVIVHLPENSSPPSTVNSTPTKSSPLRDNSVTTSLEVSTTHSKTCETPISKTKLKGILNNVRCSTRLSRGAANKQVACPVCKVDIPNRHINIHLDFCLTRDDKYDTVRRTRAKRKPMAKLVYHLLSNKELRQIVKDIGLCSIGDRATLIKRHHDFCILYNAECDSLSPRPGSYEFVILVADFLKYLIYLLIATLLTRSKQL